MTELTPELLSNIYGAESSDFFLPALEPGGVPLHGGEAMRAQPGASPPHLAYPAPQRLQPVAVAAG